MSSTFLRRGAALAAVAALALAGCSDDGKPSPTTGSTPGATSTATPAPTAASRYETPARACTAVDTKGSALAAAVTLGGELGTPPTIKVEPTFTVPAEANEMLAVCAGDGPTIAEGEIAVYVGRTVKAADSTDLNTTPFPMMMPAQKGELIDGGLAGLTVGTRLLLAAQNEGETLVQAIELVDVFPAVPTVTDAAVGDAGLPTFTAEKDTKPTVTLPPDGLAPARGITRVVLTEGEGPSLSGTDKIAAHYLGVQGSDGTEFDSSWSRGEDPTEFGLNEVVAGWTYGLTGVKVGSTVALIIPPAYGYGTNPGSPLAGETMVFVVTVEKLVDGK
ncbi:FKBP-type peptidyl-prolyl cis-trans isomerase [Sanguibacter sp. A247]|uniref:FKBP-type peptidyl-prolyl cis-trans isomerase n=1 Tax=unclassified Sanguibacter TaxID=2645534 RepID=UPI003FD74EF3